MTKPAQIFSSSEVRLSEATTGMVEMPLLFLLTGLIFLGTPLAVLRNVNGVKFRGLMVADDPECACGGMSMRIFGRQYSVFSASVMACGNPGLTTGGYREVYEVKEGEFGEWGS